MKIKTSLLQSCAIKFSKTADSKNYKASPNVKLSSKSCQCLLNMSSYIIFVFFYYCHCLNFSLPFSISQNRSVALLQVELIEFVK